MLGGEPDPVLDIAGKKLRTGPGVEYYILPVIRGSGGGLTLASSRTRNHSCPLDVVQEKHEVDNGLPLTFSPVNPKKGVVEVSTDLNVKFSGATICVQSTVWKLDLDESIGQYIVTTGGVEGNPSRETISNWFKIEILGDDYKLVFCPTVCSGTRPINTESAKSNRRVLPRLVRKSFDRRVDIFLLGFKENCVTK
ncbi:hypothetical protein F0562_015546 [Nyssa sinensis]|uniref:Uncharacterized protein n=1 Tax=Nyssa sinensis TaxID=561372 RepID=A0A5J4ZKN3_9ASTE|nr:hypothetical protein F0562_015546 [Nyssa sinensis]